MIKSLEVRAAYQLLIALFITKEDTRKKTQDHIVVTRCTYFRWLFPLISVFFEVSFHSAKMFAISFRNLENQSRMLIQHIITKLSVQLWENECFNELGNDLMFEVDSVLYFTDPEELERRRHEYCSSQSLCVIFILSFPPLIGFNGALPYYYL